MTLYEAGAKIGGQLNLARNVPGKEEFDATLHYFATRIARLGVDLQLGTRPGPEALAAGKFDEVVLATGVMPRPLDLPGADHRSCASYIEILDGTRKAGRRVAVIGAGGIGFDVAEFLTSPPQDDGGNPGAFRGGVGRRSSHRRSWRTCGQRSLPPCGGGTGGGDGRTAKVGFPPPLSPPRKGEGDRSARW